MTEAKFNEWLETQPIEDKLVSLKYKYSHEKEWTFSNEILEVEMSVDGYYVWSNDWDEGQQYVEILGCIAISDIDVPVFTQADIPQMDCYMCKWMGDRDVCGRCRNRNLFAVADTTQTECETCELDGNEPVVLERMQTERSK